MKELIFQVNQLQSELRLARSLIAEKDSEIQRVHTTNNQARTSVLAHSFFSLSLSKPR